METNKNRALKKTKVMIAAGGTGGHLFPAQALAIELLKKHPDIEITFVGSGLNTNQYFKKDHFSFLNIKSGTPVKRHPWKILKALIAISQGLTKCMGYFSKRRPDLIVGFGSYHTFPAILAAKLKKVPIMIFESNALPGRVNRFCSKWAKVSAIQFSHAADYLKSHSVCVQMPLLMKEEGMTKAKARSYFGLDPKRLTFLVFGGSQGAQSINRFFCGAVEGLIKRGVNFQVIHVVGCEQRAEKLKAFYEKHQVPAAIKVFEEKMEMAWSAADLNISRAGAATLAELIEFEVPSLLIPYPYGTENHQLKNAAFISDEIGGAITLEEKGLKGDLLANKILQLLEDEGSALKRMKTALRAFREEEKKEDLCSIVLKTL